MQRDCNKRFALFIFPHLLTKNKQGKTMKRFLRILFLTTSISLRYQGCEEDTDNPLTTDDTCSTLQTVIDNLPEEQTQAECETSYTALQEW